MGTEGEGGSGRFPSNSQVAADTTAQIQTALYLQDICCLLTLKMGIDSGLPLTYAQLISRKLGDYSKKTGN